MVRLTKVYILQKNNELWSGEVSPTDGDENRLIAALSKDQENVDDIIEGVKRQEFPWNFDYYDNTETKIERDYSKEDLDFVPVEDIGLDQLTPRKITNNMRNETVDVKTIFIDLQHHKVFSLSFGNYTGLRYEKRTYPKTFEVSTYWPDNPNQDILNLETSSKKDIPQDFTPITIEINDENSDSELLVTTELLKDLRECNHPSGTFFRSLGECVDQNYFFEINTEDIKLRPATLTELLDSPSEPERVKDFPTKGRLLRHIQEDDRRSLVEELLAGFDENDDDDD